MDINNLVRRLDNSRTVDMALPDAGRYFVALDLPRSAVDLLGAAQEGLRESLAAGARVKWVRPENLHLTLKFLGDRVTCKTAEAVIEALRGAAAGLSAFEVEVVGLSAFPSSRKARVLWAGVSDPEDRLSELHEAVEDALNPLGFDSSDFHAHITLGRVRDRKARPDLTGLLDPMSEKRFGGVDVRGVTLYRSILTPQGPQYEDIAECALR